MSYSKTFIEGFEHVVYGLDMSDIERMADELADLKKRGGRLFVLGLGGSAANASHAVNDFRKHCHIDAQAPTDNVAELTARANDDGWDTIFSRWLRGCHINRQDAILVLSVGGANEKTSRPILEAVRCAQVENATILGIVGRDGGYTKQSAKVCVLIPTTNADRITPYAEAAQAVVWHCLANHPKLQDKAPTGAGMLQKLKDMASVENMAAAREDVFKGLGIPPNLLRHGGTIEPDKQKGTLTFTTDKGEKITAPLHDVTINITNEMPKWPPSPDEWKRATQGEWPSEPPKRRAVFLDRDGVLCKMVTTHRIVTDPPTPVMRPPYTLDELELLPGVQDACAKLKAAGYLLICVTNQPDIARGKVSHSKVNLINQCLKSTLGLEAVYTCPHDDKDDCLCRKPKPGLLQQAAVNHRIDLAKSWMVGDRQVDIDAGKAARCGHQLEIATNNGSLYGMPVCGMTWAADWILMIDKEQDNARK
jgi:D-sedoheptulose 7-phosphate isomerase